MAVQEPSPRTAAPTATTDDGALPLKDAGIAAVLTVWSMVYYLQKALPEIRAKAK